jgi:hypothetical protein
VIKKVLIAVAAVIGLSVLGGLLLAVFTGPGNKIQNDATDNVTDRLASRLQPGMERRRVEGIVAAHDFRPNTTSPAKKDPEFSAAYVTAFSTGMFTWTRYDLFIKYDRSNHLESARMLKSRHSDGRDRNCVLRWEVPSGTNRSYPLPCPPGVQDF